MKIAIFRTDGSDVDLLHYNSQEVGLGRALLEKGHSVDIYTAGKGSNLSKGKSIEVIDRLEGVELRLVRLSFKKIPVLDYGVFIGARKAIKSEGYDLVHINEENNPASALIAIYCAITRTPYVIYHGMYVLPTGKARQLYEKIHNYVLRPLVRRTVKVVFCKTSLAAKFLSERGYESSSILPVGLDTVNLDTADVEKPKWLEDVESRFESIALYVGVFEQRRNIDFLLELSSHFPKERCMVLVGQGPLFEHAKQRIAQEGLEQVFIVPPIAQKELAPVYEAADVFLLASNYEIYGMVLLESMYFGIPVVCSKTGGAEDVVAQNDAGVVLTEYDVSIWNAAISRVIGESLPAQKERLKELFERKYRWGEIASGYLVKVKHGKERIEP